jgi:hypothetical protein
MAKSDNEFYVQVLVGNHRGSIGKLVSARIRYIVLFPNGKRAAYKTDKSFLIFNKKNGRIAAKMFKYAQR